MYVCACIPRYFWSIESQSWNEATLISYTFVGSSLNVLQIQIYIQMMHTMDVPGLVACVNIFYTFDP